MREGRFCGGGLVALEPRVLPALRSVLDDLGAARKSPLRLSRAVRLGHPAALCARIADRCGRRAARQRDPAERRPARSAARIPRSRSTSTAPRDVALANGLVRRHSEESRNDPRRRAAARVRHRSDARAFRRRRSASRTVTGRILVARRSDARPARRRTAGDGAAHRRDARRTRRFPRTCGAAPSFARASLAAIDRDDDDAFGELGGEYRTLLAFVNARRCRRRAAPRCWPAATRLTAGENDGEIAGDRHAAAGGRRRVRLAAARRARRHSALEPVDLGPLAAPALDLGGGRRTVCAFLRFAAAKATPMRAPRCARSSRRSIPTTRACCSRSPARAPTCST